MNSYDIVRRLEAHTAGRPVSVGACRNVTVSPDADILRVAFVRMGGESAPWGIGIRRGRSAAKFLTVPEPRNRDMVAGMALELEGPLVEFLGPSTRHRQVWLPNSTHIDMLHMLAFAYQNTRFGDEGRRLRLNALGRACNWLFREAHRPGQVRVMDVVTALRQIYAFPADDVRQQHPGFLLAWLQTPGSLDARHRAASEAEASTAATSLDPRFERDTLEPLVTRFNEARSSGDTGREKQYAAAIRDALVPELERRLDWIGQAIDLVRSDPRPENPGLQELVDHSQREIESQYRRIEERIAAGERTFVPSPETDHAPAAATTSFLRLQESAAIADFQLMLHDDELQARAIAEGQALRGEITAVREDGVGRSTVPVWTVEDRIDLPLRIRAGDRLCVSDHPSRWGVVRRVGPGSRGGRSVELEIRGHKTARRGGVSPNDPHLIGTRVLLLPTDASGLAHRKVTKVWDRTGPGSWLVHHAPRRRTPDTAEDDA